ncbi:MAG TPA: bifunctional phosphopantothenoylcysteine decarboxylase/phosphopantothenate--cysteine ligase CoaBC [Candidatus Didemnitutus sp.]|jgi:phosphopantothenoylcysteine decarboxylase/phosphopantothenate--cysteine ligase
MSHSRILFIVTGSIAAYKACTVISGLVQRGHEVRVVASPSALRFVGPATLEGLAGAPVLSDLFASGAALEHIRLTRWADLVITCPATANTLNRMAAGLADDLPGALFLAGDRTKPWLVTPAMNPAMWSHPATQSSVDKLTSWGVRLVPIGTGATACGEMGEGRMAEPEQILAAIEQTLVPAESRLNILITSGGTAEPIDRVRVITNRSTGATGALLADHFRKRGDAVTLLRATGARRSASSGDEETFETFTELQGALERLVRPGSFDVVIHAAAVGDFALDHIEIAGSVIAAGTGKLDSRRPAALHLRPNPKLLGRLRELGGPRTQIVAFKLTTGADPGEALDEVRGLLDESHPDWVVHNDERARGKGTAFPADIYDASGHLVAHCPERQAMAAVLEQVLVNRRTAV